MAESVLLDANILIKAINNKQGEEAQLLRDLLRDENKKLYITPLIRYEVLRGVCWNHRGDYLKCAQFLDAVDNLNIDKKISNTAADLFRLDRAQKQQLHQETKKIDKHNFDVMHFATAKVYGLEWVSNDKDMEGWAKLYEQLQRSIKQQVSD